MTQQVNMTKIIQAPSSAVWDALTVPGLMKQWMGDPEMRIEITTNWKVGTPIVIKGFHHIQFENKGTVLQFEPGKVLQYNYLSSLSRLEDKPENYSVITFQLTPQHNQTSLTVTMTNSPTETIFKHVEFYWRGTLEKIRQFIEQQYSS